MAGGQLAPVEWHNQHAEVILAGYLAAYREGKGADLNDADRRAALRLAAKQMPYLNKFLDELEETGWQDRYAARTAMYAESVKQAYYVGLSFGLELPAMPGDGTTKCLSNCKCSWKIVWEDQENLDARAYWRLGKAEHCPDCRRRSRQWSPLRFREGVQV